MSQWPRSRTRSGGVAHRTSSAFFEERTCSVQYVVAMTRDTVLCPHRSGARLRREVRSVGHVPPMLCWRSAARES